MSSLTRSMQRRRKRKLTTGPGRKLGVHFVQEKTERPPRGSRRGTGKGTLYTLGYGKMVEYITKNLLEK